MEKSFRRILVIKLRFHGDMLLTTPVISTLKQHYPDAKIDVLLYQDTIPILSENPDIHMLYGMSNRHTGAWGKMKNLFTLLKKLRANQYDLVVNLTDQWSVAGIVRCLAAPVKLSHQFNHRLSSFWKNSFTVHVPFSGKHIVERSLSVLTPLGIDEYVTETTMRYDPKHWEHIHRQLQKQGVDGSYVVVQPTARQLFKCWDNDKFSQVIDAIQQRGYPVILTSGPSMDDLQCINDICQKCQSNPITQLAGKTNFPELAALIDHAALFIGVDSAPGHIAAAVHTPVISLFGPTDHVVWCPWTKDMILLWAGDYQPMPARKDLDRSKKYLSVIPAEDVITAADKMLPGSIEQYKEDVH